MTKIIDKYERELVSNVTGKYKKAYIGEIGEIIHTNYLFGNSLLYDVRFADGQVWCLERSQFIEIADK